MNVSVHRGIGSNPYGNDSSSLEMATTRYSDSSIKPAPPSVCPIISHVSVHLTKASSFPSRMIRLTSADPTEITLVRQGQTEKMGLDQTTLFPGEAEAEVVVWTDAKEVEMKE